jgi:hypothetical protein
MSPIWICDPLPISAALLMKKLFGADPIPIVNNLDVLNFLFMRENNLVS